MSPGLTMLVAMMAGVPGGVAGNLLCRWLRIDTKAGFFLFMFGVAAGMTCGIFVVKAVAP